MPRLPRNIPQPTSSSRSAGRFLPLVFAVFVVALLLASPVSGENVTASTTVAGTTSPQVTEQATSVQTTTAVATTTTVTGKKSPAVKKPLIGFSAVPREGPAPLTVTFYPVFNSSGGAPLFIIWDFGDGQKENVTLGTSYQHTYLAAGSYSVTLTSYNEAGNIPVTQPAYIIVTIPPATPTPTQTTVTQTATTVVTTNVTTAVPTATPTTVMTLASSSSIQAAAPTEEFGPVPCLYSNSTSADFYASPTTGYAPLRVSFFDNSSCIPPTMWDWEFGTSVRPGLKTMQNPVITYPDPGNYTVTLVVINAFSTNSTRTRKAYVRVLPPVTPTPVRTATVPATTRIPPQISANFIANVTGGAAPLSVQFTDLSTGTQPVNWSWDFGDGSTDTGKNPVHVYRSPGTYTVVFSASAEGIPFTMTRENYVIVSTQASALTPDMMIIILVGVIVIVMVVAVVLVRGAGRGRKGESRSSEPEYEAGQSAGSHHRKDL